MELNPYDEYANVNLGSTLRRKDPKSAKEYLQRALSINPDEDIALIELGRIQQAEGDIEGAKAKFRKVYNDYLRQWEAKSLPNYAFGWFAWVAEELGEEDFAREIRQAIPIPQGDKFYNPENLSKTKTNLLINSKK